MRYSSMLPAVTILAAMLCGGGAAVAQELPRGGDLTCEGPFSSRDTGESLSALLPSKARIMEVADLSGESGDGLVLYPDDRSARIETTDANGNGTGRITSLTVKGPDTVWTVGGLAIGTTLDELTAINGGPLKLSGFWQQTDTTYTMIGWVPRGDCTVAIVMFAPPIVTTTHPLYGLDEIKSDDPRLTGAHLKIDQLTITWSEPASAE